MDKQPTPVTSPRGNSRREFLGDIGLTLAGALLPIGRVLAAPDGGNSYPADDVRHYGILPNNPSLASANTAALKVLVNPAGTFTGSLYFPNATGSDVYYFNDLIPFHDGIHLDLRKSTLSFSKTGVAHDSASGFIHAIRDFVIENGTLVTTYDYKAGYNTGNALAFGGRGMDTALFPNLYDKMMPTPMGKITVRNLRITAGGVGGSPRAMLILGGLDGILLENVSIDGRDQLTSGIYYEFGWATNEPKEIDRQTAHATNIRLTNVNVENVINEAFGANGAFEIVIDGLRLTRVGHGCTVGTGESLFFRPWVPSGNHAARPSFVARKVVGNAIKNVGFTVTGASKVSGSYLDSPTHNNPLHISADQQTDLIDFVLDDFSLNGTPNNYGVVTSAASVQIHNGTLRGFQRGIVTTQECTRFTIDAVKIFDCSSYGIQIGLGSTIHTPPRLATGTIRNCVIAGSGSNGGGAPAIVVSTTRSCVIEGCRFGYAAATDGKNEATQTQAVLVGADASGVVCRNNEVVATAKGAVAYALGGAGARDNRIESARGIQTASGAWRAR